MTLRKILLGTTAVVGAGMAALALADCGQRGRGDARRRARHLTITGFARFEAFGGEQDDLQLDRRCRAASTSATTPRSTSSPAARARRPAWSMAPRSSSRPTPTTPFNTDETWIFLRGGWGEVRLGDEDGVVDNSVVGGQTIAAGTGGIDGSDAVIIRGAGGVPDQHQRRDQGPLLHAELRRLQPRRVLHADPGGHQQRRQQRPVLRHARTAPSSAHGGQNIVEGAVGLRWRFRRRRRPGLGGRPLRRAEERRRGRRSAATSGGACRPAPTSTCSASSSPAASATTRSATTQRDFFTAGIGAALGPVNTSITYGQIFNTNCDFDEATGIGDKAYNLVFSADVALAPGLVLAGDVSKFDNDSHGATPAPATRAGPRWAASAWRSDRSGSRDAGGGACPAALRFDRRVDLR